MVWRGRKDQMKGEKENLEKQIDHIRKKLNYSIQQNSENLANHQVLHISKELDDIIVKYYKLQNNDKYMSKE
jgi:hypothetical protein